MICDETCENSQVSASKKWLTLAALTCNWQLTLANFRKFHRCPMGIHGTLRYLLISLLLINILGQASLGNK